MTTDPETTPLTPPSLTKCLMAGFDAVGNHIGLILFPIGLDLLLWFGPRLSLLQWVGKVLDQTAAMPEMSTPDMAEMMAASRTVWTAVMERFNLFSVLRSLPVGVPSLMASRSPLEAPLGMPLTLEMPSFLLIVGMWLALTLVGLIAGTLYFSVVAQAALVGKVSYRHALRSWPWASAQVVLLALFWVSLLLMVSLPFSCLLSVTVMTGLNVGRFVVFMMAGLLAWMLLPLVFSPHGIFIHGQNVWTSIKAGARLVRFSLPATALFCLFLLVLSEGLDILWRIPSETSWFSLIGLAGHAFITTGLLAATFVYYREVERWSQKVLQQAKLFSLTKV